MVNGSRIKFLFAVSVATLAASSLMVGMNNRRFHASSEALGFTSNQIQSLDSLKQEFERRFTDPENKEFGMSRLAGPNAGRHRPLVGSARGLQRWITLDNGERQHQSLGDGKWIKTIDIKPVVKAENEREESAMQQLNDSNVDVAVYTIGQFDLDKGETPTPITQPAGGNPHLQFFEYGGFDGIRVKGPAYIRQTSATAPRAYELVNFGRLAWASHQDDYTAKGKDGWIYFARRVSMTDKDCVSCHSSNSAALGPSMKKPGDPVGLFVVALRRADAK